MKTKTIPALITLTAGLITCIVSFLSNVSMEKFVASLFLTVLIFFMLGSVIKLVLDRNFPPEPEEMEAEENEEQQPEEDRQEEQQGQQEQEEQPEQQEQ